VRKRKLLPALRNEWRRPLSPSIRCESMTAKQDPHTSRAERKITVAAVFDLIIDILAYSSGALVLFMMLMISADVVLRKVAGFTFEWANEFTENAVSYITFTTAAWLARQDRHVVVDMVVTQLNSRNRIILNAATSMLGAATCIFMTYHAYLTMMDVWRRHAATATAMEIPMAPLISFIAVGMLLLSIQFLRNAYSRFRQLGGKQPLIIAHSDADESFDLE
jgi:TRAP-type C4-dicarboxylate transport system permease small subunit